MLTKVQIVQNLPNEPTSLSRNAEEIIRKITESRLKKEILQEIQRELELLREGKIKSISYNNDQFETEKEISTKDNLNEELINLKDYKLTSQVAKYFSESHINKTNLFNESKTNLNSGNNIKNLCQMFSSSEKNEYVSKLLTQDEAEKRIEEEIKEIIQKENELKNLRNLLTSKNSKCTNEDEENKIETCINNTNASSIKKRSDVGSFTTKASVIKIRKISKLYLVDKWEKIRNDGPPYLTS